MSMLEQVAKAIHDELENDDDSGGGGYMRAARVALLAMQEPTASVVRACHYKIIEKTNGEARDFTFGFARTYKLMIETILEEAK